MALSRKDLITLGIQVANASPKAPVAYSFGNEKFSYEDLHETLRSELYSLVGTPELYRENKNTLFTIMEQVVNDVLPKKVLEQYGRFAEVKTFSQGDKPVFTQRITQHARRRAKQFITKVGLAGVYEVFKLDGYSFEVPTSAFGGAAQISFEEFLDGRADFSEYIQIVMDGLDECIYLEIERALKAAVTNLQASNKTTQTTFVEKEMDNLLQKADSYGTATIYCTYEFAATMIPAEGWASNDMKDQLWNTGYIANYKGHRVIVLPQSYEDETNTKKVIDPAYAWIIPSGGEKPVKIAFEGTPHTREVENHDWSKDIQIYQKVGVGTIITNNIFVYMNTSLTTD